MLGKKFYLHLELAPGFDVWSRGHLRMTVMHLPPLRIAYRFSQSGKLLHHAQHFQKHCNINYIHTRKDHTNRNVAHRYM